MITVETIRRANQAMIERRPIDYGAFPPAVVKILREMKYSAAEMNAAYAKARKP